MIAGDRDDIVPESLSRRLYDAAGEPKNWVLVAGVGHNDRDLLDGRQMLDEIEGSCRRQVSPSDTGEREACHL